MCGDQDSWKHSLIECHPARCVWALQCDEIIEFIVSTQQQDARGWLHEAMKFLSHDELVRVTVTLWAIWYAKRKIIHENIHQSPLSTYYFVERFLADLGTSKSTGNARQPTQAKQTRWIPPPPGFVKINVDAALAKNSTKVTMAAVPRDEAGNFVGASALVMEGISDSEMAEVMVCRPGFGPAQVARPHRAPKILGPHLQFFLGGLGPITEQLKHIAHHWNMPGCLRSTDLFVIP